MSVSGAIQLWSSRFHFVSLAIVSPAVHSDPIQVPLRAHVVHRTLKPRQLGARSHRHAFGPRMKIAHSFHHQSKRPVAGVKKLARRGPSPASEVRLASRFAGLPLTVTPRRPMFNVAPSSPRQPQMWSWSTVGRLRSSRRTKSTASILLPT